MSREWTDNQRKAIEARGMQVLVSAAAGSGKTAVLTERVKNILCDTQNPCAVSDLLVVTFTRAAANEMRTRIYDALKSEISSNVINSADLRRKMTLLPTADICTIDSFCSKIVRDNFALAGVGVDFKLLDEKDAEEMIDAALKTVVDELYEENDNAFKSLTAMFLSERDDKVLSDVIKTLYKYSRSYPSPEIWLNDLSSAFEKTKSPNETPWADIIYKYLVLFSDFYYTRLTRCVSLMEEAGGFNPDYFTRFTSGADNLKALKTAATDKNWEATVQIIRNGLVNKIPARNYKVDENLKKLTQDVFDEFEKDVQNLQKRTLPTLSEHSEDSEKLYPIVKKLCNAVERLSDVLEKEKKAKDTYSFDDILHKCIDLLVDFKGNGWVPTPLAQSLRKKYKEILIDEYQDTNDAQNIVFEAVSRDCENLYCVGDVKQSIYGFRLASPELFMNLRRNLPEYDGKKHPSQISLDKNFRSRKGVDDAVNFVFHALMSEQVGEIEYSEKEKLVFGAVGYPEKNLSDTEFVCVDTGSLKSADATIKEAQAVADYVERILKSKVNVKSENGQRPVRSSDICILLRSMKDKVNIYTQALKDKGIPYSTVADFDISDSKEVAFLISLVKVINNPLDDIALTSVLLSPVFGFSVDELAEIRMLEYDAPLFVCLERYADNSQNAKYFIEKFNLYRNISSAFPIDEFVRFIVDDTSVCEIYPAAGDGEQRLLNIKGFVKFAEKFTAGGKKGTGAFVRYIDNATADGSLKGYGATVGEGVRIMSVHKSKGLEFPYVLLADCSKTFNRLDSRGSLTLSRETGIGLKIRDDEKFTRYHTLSSAATEKALLFSGASEELRVLYVAMTRAKEHLTFFCTVGSKTLAKRVMLNSIFSTDRNGVVHPYAVYRANSVSEWLMTCFASHRDCGVVRGVCGLKGSDYKDYDFNVDTAYVEPLAEKIDETPAAIPSEAPVDMEILKTLRECAEYTYEYDTSGILAKISASATENNKMQREFFAATKPAFLNEELSGAQRGTVIHRFLELCDFKSAALDLQAEKKRLSESGIVSEKELSILDDDAVNMFFHSPIGKRMLRSQKIYKEYEFAFLKKASDLYGDTVRNAADEEIVVQGKLDCAFTENGKAVLIDYKTDSLSDEEKFRQIYSPQIEIYAEALKICTGFDVDEKYLYSFKLKKFISL